MSRIVIGVLCCALAIQPSAAMAKTKSHGTMFWLVGGLATGAVALGALQKRQCKKAVTSGQIGADIPRPCFADQVLERSYGTGTLRGQLDIERQAMGMPPNPNDCDGHHIVPQKEGRAWAEKAANEARRVLDLCSQSA